jgi:hypothetical protein
MTTITRRDRPENVNVLRIEAPDAASARAVGARINIAEGHGTPLDVAQFIRDSGLNAGDLEKEGISLRGDLAQKGTALSQLAPDLMAKVATGELQESHGVAIGDMLVGEPELQREVAAEVKRAKVRLSADDVREVARQVKAAGTEDVRQETLFGGEVGRKPLFVERARLASTILKKLGADRRVLGFVADQNRAQILAKGGNVIDVERSRELADQSAQLEELFQRLYTRDGPIAKVLTQAAGRVARGEAVRAVTDDIYASVATAVQAEIQGSTRGGADTREAEGSRGVSSSTPEAGGLTFSLEGAKTGQPLTVRTFRGEGAAGPKYGEFSAGVPILGSGRYGTPNRTFAEHFGDVTEHTAHLENPLVITSDVEWRELTRAAGWQFPNPVGLPKEVQVAGINKLRASIEAKGHDGVVIRIPEEGDLGKTMRNVFDSDTIVEFNPPKSEHVELDPNQDDMFGVGSPQMRPETQASYNSFLARRKAAFLHAYRESHSVQGAAEAAGVGTTSVDKWRAKDPEFDKAIREIHEPHVGGTKRAAPTTKFDEQLPIEKRKAAYLEALQKTNSVEKAAAAVDIDKSNVVYWRRTDGGFRAAEMSIKQPRSFRKSQDVQEAPKPEPKPELQRMDVDDLKDHLAGLRASVEASGGFDVDRNRRAFNHEAAEIMKAIDSLDALKAARVKLDELAEDFTQIEGVDHQMDELRKTPAELHRDRQARYVARQRGETGDDVDLRKPGNAIGTRHRNVDPSPKAQAHRDRQDRYMARKRAGEQPSTTPPPAAPAPVDEAVQRYRAEKAARAARIAENRVEESRPEYDHSSTQVNLPSKTAAAIIKLGNKIPDEDLAENGREKEPHITVKYGLHGNDPDAVRKLLENEMPFDVEFGTTSYFPNGESGNGDVVKVDVDSPALHALNKKIADALPNTETHPTYKPHATIAFVKPGLGKKYSGNGDLLGRKVRVSSVAFSDKNGNQTRIKLGGKEAPQVIIFDRHGFLESKTPHEIDTIGNGHHSQTFSKKALNIQDQGAIAYINRQGEITVNVGAGAGISNKRINEVVKEHWPNAVGKDVTIIRQSADWSLDNTIEDMRVGEERNNYMAAIADLWERSGPNGRADLIRKFAKLDNPLNNNKWDVEWNALPVEKLPRHVQDALGRERAWEIIMMSAMGVKEDLFGYGPEQGGLLPDDAGTAAQQKKKSVSFEKAAKDAEAQIDFLRKQLARMGDDPKYVGKTGPIRAAISELEKIANFSKKVTTEEIKLQGEKGAGDGGSIDMFGVKEGEHIQPNKLTALVMQLEDLSEEILGKLNDQERMLSKLEDLQPQLGDNFGTKDLQQLRAEFRGLYAGMERVSKDLSAEGRNVEKTGIASNRFINLTHEWNGLSVDYERFVEALDRFRAKRETRRMIGDMFQWEEGRAGYAPLKVGQTVNFDVRGMRRGKIVKQLPDENGQPYFQIHETLSPGHVQSHKVGLARIDTLRGVEEDRADYEATKQLELTFGSKRKWRRLRPTSSRTPASTSRSRTRTSSGRRSCRRASARRTSRRRRSAAPGCRSSGRRSRGRTSSRS